VLGGASLIENEVSTPNGLRAESRRDQRRDASDAAFDRRDSGAQLGRQRF
jgi:hypothetical protein